MKMFIFAVSMMVSVVACSTMPKPTALRASASETDVRGTAAVHAHRARALVSGPAVVKHLETEGRGVVTLYLEDDPGVGDRRCVSAEAEGESPIAVLVRARQVTDVAVPACKRICASITATEFMTLAWHARKTDAAVQGPFDVALLTR